MKPITIFVCLFNLTLCLNSQTIEGFVKESESNTPLPGVSIYLLNTDFGSSTNGKGFFSIENIPAGTYTLVYSSIGFIEIQKEISVTNGHKTDHSVALSESISELNEVSIISKGKSGIKDIPGSVQYISKKELDKFSYTDVHRTLRTVPGVNIQEEDGYGLRPNIGLRATGVERSSKITVMEDGILSAPAPYVAPAAYYFPTMGRMQGMEIMKGSSQIKYGPYTTGGALNLISTQIPNKFGGNLNVMGGNFNGRNVHANVGNSHKNISYMIETFQFSSDGFKELDGGGNTGFQKSDYLAKVQINTNNSAKYQQHLLLKIGQTNELSNETYAGLSQEDFDANPYRRYASSQNDVMKNQQRQYSATHSIGLSNAILLTTSIYRTDFHRNWYKLDKIKDTSGSAISISTILDNPQAYQREYTTLKGASSDQNADILLKANNRSYYSQGIQSKFTMQFDTEKADHQLELGIRLHEDEVDRFQWIDEYTMDNGDLKLSNAGQAGSESNRIESAKAIATYAHYQFKYLNISITPGLRFEHISLFKQDFGKNDVDRLGGDLKENRNEVSVFLPGIGFDYKFNNHMGVFAGLHKGFAPPGTNEGTNPEESVNFEVGSRFQKGVFAWQIVGFLNRYSNLLGADLNANGGTGSGDLYNGGAAEAIGLEFSMNYDLLSRNVRSKVSLPFTITYTYTDAHFLSDFDSDFEGWGAVNKGDQLPYLAMHQASFQLGFRYEKFSFNASARYVSDMRSSPGQGSIPINEIINAHFIADLSMDYQLHKQLKAFASLNNAGNQVYLVSRRPAGLRPGAPRMLIGGLKAAF